MFARLAKQEIPKAVWFLTGTTTAMGVFMVVGLTFFEQNLTRPSKMLVYGGNNTNPGAPQV
eukprot:scaffold1403_cov180-Ochromonas_danica.AAC.1